jgi:hypothetical protein
VALHRARPIWRLQHPVLAFPESTTSTIGLITLGVKATGKRSAGNPHAAFDVAGNGNLASVVAPFLDPTCEGAVG